jgi:Domain of unknown function (DUF4431)
MTLVLLLLLTMPPVTGLCPSYAPERVVLKGTVKRQTFPGPPNYESIANGDRVETIWVLHLAQSICVSANAEWEHESRVSDVQLVFSGNEYEKPLVDRKVVATGTLYHAHTGHHHTKVLLTVSIIATSSPS